MYFRSRPMVEFIINSECWEVTLVSNHSCLALIIFNYRDNYFTTILKAFPQLINFKFLDTIPNHFL